MNVTDSIPKQPSAKAQTGRFESNRLTAEPSHDTLVVRAASLLLGAALRGWLSTREKEYLQSLAPGKARTFLLHGEQYLHPADSDLLPVDRLRSTVHQGGTATYSHRCETGCTCSPGVCRVLTAVIGHEADEPIVLGMFGPDTLDTRHVVEDEFQRVVDAFRIARQSVARFLETLSPAADGAGRLLINRASGRVLHVDPFICSAVNREPFDFVSREYNTVEPLLGSLLRKFKTKLQNLSCGPLHVACMTFSPVGASSPSQGSIQFSLLETLRGDLTAMTSTADYLAAESAALDPEDIQLLAARIARAGERLDRRLSRFHLLANYDHLDTGRVDILQQLEQAIDRTDDQRAHIKLSIDPEIELTAFNTPADAFRLLFESILDLHRFAPGNPGDTAISLQGLPGTAGELVFATDIPHTIRLSDLERIWFQDTEKLARRLSLTVSRKLQLESNLLVTRVTLPAQETNA